MKLTIFVVLIRLCALLITSCGDNKTEIEKVTARDTPSHIAKEYHKISEDLVKINFSCANPKDCPTNLGLIFSNSNGFGQNPEISQCTGFLVEEDLVATSSNCIPILVKSGSVPCESSLAIKFIGIEGEKSVFSCREMLNYRDGQQNASEYIYFRIDKTNREPLNIHKNGLADSQNIRIGRIIPSEQSNGAKLSVETCKVSFGTILNLNGTNPWSKTGTALGCEPLPGIAGSPVMDQGGNILGIVKNISVNDYTRNLKRAYTNFDLEFPKKIAPYLIFTNWSCVQDPINGEPNKRECDKAEESSNRNYCAQYFSAGYNYSNLEGYFQDWRDQLPPIFVFEIVVDEKSGLIESLPICVKPEEKFKDYSEYSEVVGFPGFRKERLNVIYESGINTNLEIQVDDMYRVRPKINVSEGSGYRTRVYMVKNGNIWTGHSKHTYRDWKNLLDVFEEKSMFNLPECSEEQLKTKVLIKKKGKSGKSVSEQILNTSSEALEVFKCGV